MFPIFQNLLFFSPLSSLDHLSSRSTTDLAPSALFSGASVFLLNFFQPIDSTFIKRLELCLIGSSEMRALISGSIVSLGRFSMIACGAFNTWEKK